MNLCLPINHASMTPLYLQIAGEIRRLIETASLSPGVRLPSSRSLADSLGVSRCTITQAYTELAIKGYVRMESGSGTYVENPCIAFAPPPVLEASDCIRLSAAGKRLMSDKLEREIDAELSDKLNNFCMDCSLLPVEQWYRVMSRVRQSARTEISVTEDTFGSMELRKALAGYLFRSRSINAPIERLAIFSSCQIALDLLVRLLVDEGEPVLLEEPGFAGIRRSVLANGSRPIGIPVDARGLNTSLMASESARLAYVTPNRQFPTGVSLSESRRADLLSWAKIFDAYVIEDDFEAELSYAPRSLPALKATDRDERVIYVSSFWSLLFPLTHISFAVLPQSLVEPIRRAKATFDRNVPAMEQLTLSDFLAHGFLERHIRAVRCNYQLKRGDLIRRLNDLFRGTVKIAPSGSGSTLLLNFSSSIKHQNILELSQMAQLPMVSTKPFYLGEGPDNEFLLSFADFESEEFNARLSEFARQVYARVSVARSPAA